MEEEVYFEPTRAQKIRKWTIRGLIAAVLLSLFVVLLVRMFISVPRGVMRDLTFTDTTSSAYLACNGELHVNEPSLLSYISDTGFLQVRYVYYVEESRELQLTVYYNARDPMAQTIPEDTLFPFDIVLNLNSGEDTVSEVPASHMQTLQGEVLSEEQHWMYRFARIHFYDVDLQDVGTLWLHLNYQGESIDDIMIYHRDMNLKAYRYQGDVPKELKQQLKEQA